MIQKSKREDQKNILKNQMKHLFVFAALVGLISCSEPVETTPVTEAPVETEATTVDSVVTLPADTAAVSPATAQ